MMPNQMKQQLKQRRTVYGQSFFNSPPYPQTPLMNKDFEDGNVEKGGLAERTRNSQLDSSVRRKR